MVGDQVAGVGGTTNGASQLEDDGGGNDGQELALEVVDRTNTNKTHVWGLNQQLKKRTLRKTRMGLKGLSLDIFWPVFFL